MKLDGFEKHLESLLPAAETRPVVLSQALRWAVMGGGKRVRPQVCMAAACAAGGAAEDALYPACAIEFLHAYTLVHDDLPEMDNDTIRRGKPSVWAKFGADIAILAGDRLQALAFATALRTPRQGVAVTTALARAAQAVVSGQVEDLAANASNVSQLTEQDLSAIFTGKTAALFVAAAEMGALAADAPDAVVTQLAIVARHLGLAFQYEDDLLDGADGTFSSLTLLGAEEVQQRIARHTTSAQTALQGLPGDTSFLMNLAERLAQRRT